jgi:HK97 family phage portal protein
MFNTLFNAFNVKFKIGDETSSPSFSSLLANADFIKNNSDEISTIFTCKKIIIDTISKLPLNLNLNGKKAESHYLFDLIHYNPNNYQTINTFLSTITNHILEFGNAFASITKQAGKPVSLNIIHPLKFKKYTLNENGFLVYEFENNLKIKADELLHFKIYSDDGILGIPIIDALIPQLAANFQANNIINSHYKNGLHSNLFLKSMQNVNNNEYNKAQQEWIKSNTGVFKAGQVTNLPFGTEVQAVNLQFSDAHLLPTIKYNTSQIGAAFGVPLFMLGIEEMKYKSIEEALIAFQSTTIQPLAKMIKEEFSSKLLFLKERKKGYEIELNLKAMLQADSVTRANYLKTMLGSSVISPNEAAKIEGYDTFQGGEYHYTQAQQQPLEIITQNGEYKPVTSGNNLNFNIEK